MSSTQRPADHTAQPDTANLPPLKGPCPRAEDLIRAASGELSPAERAQIRGHAAQCQSCAATWKAAGGSDPNPAGTSSAQELAPAAPATAASSSSVRTRFVVIAVSFCLLVAAGIVAIREVSTRLRRAIPQSTLARTGARPIPRSAPGSTVSPAQIAGRVDDVQQTLGSLRRSNERFRNELRRQPAASRSEQLVELTTTSAPPTILRAETSGAFAAIVRLPAQPAATVTIVDARGTALWSRPTTAGSATVKIHFPAGGLPAGNYRVIAYDIAHNQVADYPFALADPK